MKGIKNRIFKNWKSSLVGLFLLIGCFGCVLLGKASFLDVTPVLAVGVGCFGIKDPRNMTLKVVVLLFATSLVASSCSPEKRLRRLLTRHPELMQKDTITIRDSFLIPEIKFDTIFKTNFDTIKIEKEKFSIKLVKKDSLIYLDYIYPSDTVYIERKIPVDKIVYPPKQDKKMPLLEIFALIVLGFLFYMVLKN